MTNTLTGKLTDVCDAIFDLLTTEANDLGLKAVYYGDQDRIPTTPVACVEPDDKNKAYKGGGMGSYLKVDFTVYILVYHDLITSPQTNRRGANLLAEDIETLLAQNSRLDGLVIESLVTQNTSGYAKKANQLMRASRLTWTGLSQTLLTS